LSNSIIFYNFFILSIIIFEVVAPLQTAHAQYTFQDLDGIEIKAVEEYPSIKSNEFTAGVSSLPFDPYYYGFALNGGYTRYFNKDWGWQIVDLMMIFGTEKPLTTGLVEDPDVQADPDVIEKAKFLASTNLKYVISYGKSIFFDRYIRLTRTEIIAGIGALNTSEQTYLTVNLGLQLDFVMSEHFSWKFEMVNYYPTGKADVAILDYTALTLKSAWRFK
jgi:hypothetical protein